MRSVSPSQALAACMFAGALLAACGEPTPPAPPVVEVFTPGNTFSPFTANVTTGGIVRFNIFGDEHNVIFSHATPGYPADINVVRDVIVDRTFQVVGTFPYSCTVHPGMNGEIVVK